MKEFTNDPGGHKVSDPGGWKEELDRNRYIVHRWSLTALFLL